MPIKECLKLLYAPGLFTASLWPTVDEALKLAQFIVAIGSTIFLYYQIKKIRFELREKSPPSPDTESDAGGV